jgi:cellulose biosynthesis protein BcsQ
MALTVALVGVKGGVGKTTTAVNLAGLAAAGGLRTVVWDLDPQAAASYALGFDKRGGGAARNLTRKRPNLEDAAFRTATPGLDLIPADISLRTLDLALADRGRPRGRVRNALDSLHDQYDVAFIDCAPGISLANESAMRAAQIYLAPIVPSALSVRAFEQLETYVNDTPKAAGRLLGFLSMIDRRKRVHRETAVRLARETDALLRTAIPASAAVEAAPPHGRPFVSGRTAHRVAMAYRDLWNEIQTTTFGQHIDLTVEDEPSVRRPKPSARAS